MLQDCQATTSIATVTLRWSCRRCLFFCVASLLATGACSTSAELSKEPAGGERVLVWSDEFEQTGLPDSVRWDYDVGASGWGNRELQAYTRARPENARIEDGILILEARREPMDGAAYSSARLVTRDRQLFQGVYLEVRARLPTGLGTWPAIWMLGNRIGELGWPTCGEIDIMEHVGFAPDTVYGTIHCEAYNHMLGTQKMGQVAVADAEDSFHTYAVDWRDTSITFLVDETPYHHVSRDSAATLAQWPFDEPHYLLLNLAVGGNWGGRNGVDSTIWPQRMEVDWVRAWDRAPAFSTGNH